MIFAAFAQRPGSTASVTSLCQQRSAGLRIPKRPTVNALPSSRAGRHCSAGRNEIGGPIIRTLAANVCGL
jgi:hypothetical protein